MSSRSLSLLFSVNNSAPVSDSVFYQLAGLLYTQKQSLGFTTFFSSHSREPEARLSVFECYWQQQRYNFPSEIFTQFLSWNFLHTDIVSAVFASRCRNFTHLARGCTRGSNKTSMLLLRWDFLFLFRLFRNWWATGRFYADLCSGYFISLFSECRTLKAFSNTKVAFKGQAI